MDTVFFSGVGGSWHCAPFGRNCLLSVSLKLGRKLRPQGLDFGCSAAVKNDVAKVRNWCAFCGEIKNQIAKP